MALGERPDFGVQFGVVPIGSDDRHVQVVVACIVSLIVLPCPVVIAMIEAFDSCGERVYPRAEVPLKPQPYGGTNDR